MSQRALGDALGLGKRVGSTRINRYERLTSECDMATAQRISEVLEIPLAYLFAESDLQAEALRTIDLLDEPGRAAVLQYIRKKAR